MPHVPGPASAAPSARMGHIAVAVDARESWGDEILIVHGGLSEGKYALGDVVVFQTEGNAWSRPDIPSAGPHARAFHCATVVSTKVFVFGGHVWVKEKKGLQKFNDLWCLNTVRMFESNLLYTSCSTVTYSDLTSASDNVTNDCYFTLSLLPSRSMCALINTLFHRTTGSGTR